MSRPGQLQRVFYSRLSNLTVNAVPESGADLDGCCIEAAILSLTEDRDVRFTFNGYEYHASPDILAECVRQSASKEGKK